MMKARLFNPGFKYVSADQTDIRKTFTRARQKIEEAKKRAGREESSGQQKIYAIPRRAT